MTHPDPIAAYHAAQSSQDRQICERLREAIEAGLSDAESKVWHGHPVWFLDGNPIAGYSKQKPGIRLMFWSGADFAEPALNVLGAKFKDASIFYTDADQIDREALDRWLQKARSVQWDYKNIVKRKGLLERIN